MDRDGRAERGLPDRTQDMGANKTILDDWNQALLDVHMASLLECLPEIDVKNTVPDMNAPADDTSALSGRRRVTVHNKP